MSPPRFRKKEQKFRVTITHYSTSEIEIIAPSRDVAKMLAEKEWEKNMNIDMNFQFSEVTKVQCLGAARPPRFRP